MQESVQNPPYDRLLQLPWYTEGPVVDTAGNIYFTTLQGGKIMKLDPKGRLADWAAGIKPNGQLILPGGDHLVCDSGNASISRYAADGSFINYDILGKCAGATVSVPNDLVVDSEGGVYFTDSIRENGKVYYYQPGGEQRLIAQGLDFPNGLALSEDEKILFIAESYKNRILSIPLHTSGTVANQPEVFADLPVNQYPGGYNLPDGVKLGKDGNLWVAHYGMQAVQVLDSGGNLIRTIAVDFPLPSNLYLTDHHLIVTGGYAEPGPGGLCKVPLS